MQTKVSFGKVPGETEYSIIVEPNIGFEVWTRDLDVQLDYDKPNHPNDIIPEYITDWFKQKNITAQLSGGIHKAGKLKLAYMFPRKQDGMLFKLVWS